MVKGFVDEARKIRFWWVTMQPFIGARKDFSRVRLYLDSSWPLLFVRGSQKPGGKMGIIWSSNSFQPEKYI